MVYYYMVLLFVYKYLEGGANEIKNKVIGVIGKIWEKQ